METADTTGLLQVLCTETQVRAQAAGDSAPATYNLPFSLPKHRVTRAGKGAADSVPVFSPAWRIEEEKKKKMSKGVAYSGHEGSRPLLRKEWDLESKTELQATESYPTTRVFLHPNDTCINSTARLGQRLCVKVTVYRKDRVTPSNPLLQMGPQAPALGLLSGAHCGVHCSSFVVTQDHRTDSGQWILRRYNGVAFLSLCKCTRLVG